MYYSGQCHVTHVHASPVPLISRIMSHTLSHILTYQHALHPPMLLETPATEFHSSSLFPCGQLSCPDHLLSISFFYFHSPPNPDLMTSPLACVGRGLPSGPHAPVILLVFYTQLITRSDRTLFSSNISILISTAGTFYLSSLFHQTPVRLWTGALHSGQTCFHSGCNTLLAVL